MELQYVPIKELSARYAEGWRMVQPLDPNDYAALMRAPSAPEPNTHNAAISRNLTRKPKPKPKQEPIGATATVAQVAPTSDVERVMRAFGVSLPKAQILLMLINRGIASHETIIGTIYADDERIENPIGAIRDHVKRLRPSLKKSGISFETSYGYGFEMSDAMRQRARSLLHGSSA
jgi:hypothetical protein